jgi:hypothetical protein
LAGGTAILAEMIPRGVGFAVTAGDDGGPDM